MMFFKIGTKIFSKLQLSYFSQYAVYNQVFSNAFQNGRFYLHQQVTVKARTFVLEFSLLIYVFGTNLG